jgi:hypothetical protein
MRGRQQVPLLRWVRLSAQNKIDEAGRLDDLPGVTGRVRWLTTKPLPGRPVLGHPKLPTSTPIVRAGNPFQASPGIVRRFPGHVFLRTNSLHKPTPHLPGTEGKILVLERRAAAARYGRRRNAESLFHPLDADMDQEHLVRVPLERTEDTIHFSDPTWIGWRVLTEAEYRAEDHYEPYWEQAWREEESLKLARSHTPGPVRMPKKC